jgi:hypothetical protein
VQAGTVSVTNVGNGWYRISASGASTFTGLNVIWIVLSNGTTINYTGNGYSGLYIWGAQVEAGSFATSYIPTVASQVTRSPDSASMTGTNFSSWYRADEGTLCEYTNYGGLRNPGTDSILFLSSSVGGITDAIILGNTSGSSYFRVRVNSTDVALVSSGIITVGSSTNRAIAYKVNDFAGSNNGAAVVTDSSGAIPVVSSMTISAGQTARTIQKIAYYPKRLTNAELQGLTTI